MIQRKHIKEWLISLALNAALGFLTFLSAWLNQANSLLGNGPYSAKKAWKREGQFFVDIVRGRI